MTLPVIGSTDALTYFTGTVREAAWIAVTDPDAQLNEAQRWLGSLCWDETKDCCGRDFQQAYLSAVCELALALSATPTAIIGEASSAGAIKRAQLGGLSVEYFESGAGSVSKYGPNAPLVLQRFNWLGDILGCWLNVPTGSSRIIARVRS
jgi:hypothetical protein